MLIADVLNKDATLNAYEVIESLSFIPGSQTKLVMQLKQPDRANQLRYIPPVTATLTVTLSRKDGDEEAISMTVWADDRSIWYAELSETLTDAIVGGNFTFSLDVLGDGTQIEKGWVRNGLNRIVTGSC